MKCIILAAGKGSRMGKLTEETPKPLLEIKNNKTILDFIFESLPEKIGEVIIVVNHLSEIFEEEIKKKYKDFNKKIVFVKKNKKNGTLGSVYAAKKFLKKEKSFLVLQGDDIHQKKYLEKIIKQT
jgi:NDP-sugar pyrophosphorylase family protein